MSFDLSQYLSARRFIVEQTLRGFLDPVVTGTDRLHESIRYSLFCGGKRLRPILAMAGAEAICGQSDQVLRLACAVECIHTFSLIHDDLPAIDDDTMRRGSPTNHVVYGEAMAILAGDALLALAFELIADSRDALPPERVLETLAIVARASGTQGMVGGQVADIENEGREDLDESTVASIHARKTGALLTASLLGGACLSGASAAQLQSLRNYGNEVGLAFQIIDDILDLEGDAQKLGKPIGSDLKQDKATYPKVLGIEQSRSLANEAAARAIAHLQDFGPNAEPLRALALYFVERDS